ncbi:MAG: SMC family ATPase [Saprospiraceae bacterium]|nr:SMC family ATPase [Saprospiraceae bacterium]
MILRTLHLENYKQYGTLDLEFREGLVGIIGRNGAGKSTLFEAILYCLYGKDESNKNLIRSAFADPKATVVLQLQFAIGPTEYRVDRSFRGKAMAVNAELFKNNEMVAKGVAPVNEEIIKILNMERDAFKRSVFSGQKELSELSDTSGEARKRMVRKMIGLDTLDDVQSRMNINTRDLINQIAGQQQNLLDPKVSALLETDIAEQTKLLDKATKQLKNEQKKLIAVEADYQTARQKFEVEAQKQQQFQAVQQELSRLQERLDGFRNQRENLKEKIAALEAQQKDLQAQKPTFESYERDKKNLQQLALDRQKHLNQKTNLEQLTELEPSLQQSRERLAELSGLLANAEQIGQDVLKQKTQIETLESTIEQKREAFSQVKSQIDALAVRVDERRSKIKDLQQIGKEGTCPTCFQPVLNAYEQVLEKLNLEIEALQGKELQTLQQQQETVRKEGLQLRQQHGEIAKTLQDLLAQQTRLQEFAKQKTYEAGILKKYEAQVTKIQAILQEIGVVHFDESQYNALKSQVEATEPQYLKFTNEQAYVLRELPQAKNALQQAEADIVKTEQSIGTQQAALAKTDYQPARYETAKNTLTQYGEAYSAQSGQVSQLEKNCIEHHNNIERARGKLEADEQIRAQISTKLEDVELLKKLSELLIQFKTEILEKVSPGISREASELFSRITKGKYERIQVDENFDFAIADGGILYPIERFSGGEIDLANFCLRIAITKAIMDLSGNSQGVEFLAFDEIFGSQDEERRHEMMLALYYLQEQFRQIYIVSHIDSQKDYFPSLLEVSYQPEGSVVKWI